MNMSPPSGQARIGGGALGVTFLAVATGALPVAGLSFQPRPRPAPPPVAAVEVPDEQVLAEPVVIDAVGPPNDARLRVADLASRGPVRLDVALGQSAVLRGDGRVDVVCGVTIAADAQEARGPIDLALVVDTSASMSGVIGLVRRATLGVIERLRDGDRLVLVTYADEPKVVFQGPVTAEARGELERVVARFVAARGTNIAGGMEAGRAGLSALRAGERREPGPGRRAGPAPLQRLVLLSDGAPTVGETEPRVLTAAAARVREDGVTASCVGLGGSYQETLLANMADSGGGSFHHVDGPAALARVYEAEVEALRALALRGARLRLTTRPGVDVEQVTAWSHERQADGVTVALGDLSRGRALKVVARLRVADGELSDDAARDLVSVRLEGQGEGELQGEVALETLWLRAALTDDAAAAARSLAPEVQADLRQAGVAERLGQARAAVERGEGEAARGLVREARALAGRADVTFEAPSGETQAVSLDALADELAEGPGSERGRRAMKVTIAAERGAGRAR